MIQAIAALCPSCEEHGADSWAASVTLSALVCPRCGDVVEIPPMKELTQPVKGTPQRKVLDACRQLQTKGPVTYTAICVLTGYRTKSTVWFIVQRLIEKGWMSADPRKTGTLRAL